MQARISEPEVREKSIHWVGSSGRKGRLVAHKGTDQPSKYTESSRADRMELQIPEGRKLGGRLWAGIGWNASLELMFSDIQRHIYK